MVSEVAVTEQASYSKEYPLKFVEGRSRTGRFAARRSNRAKKIRPFHAGSRACRTRASWLDDLQPAFGQRRFFYEDTLEKMIEAAGA